MLNEHIRSSATFSLPKGPPPHFLSTTALHRLAQGFVLNAACFQKASEGSFCCHLQGNVSLSTPTPRDEVGEWFARQLREKGQKLTRNHKGNGNAPYKAFEIEQAPTP
jgi:hypothetical protein